MAEGGVKHFRCLCLVFGNIVVSLWVPLGTGISPLTGHAGWAPWSSLMAVAAGGMAIAGGILLFTGMNQEATSRERAGKIECVTPAQPTDSPGPTRERSPLPPTR